MPVVNGTNGNDFIHRLGDGRSVPAGYLDVTGVTTGNDTIYGFAGNDFIFGDLGNDMINGGTGADTMDGGAGNDWYYVDAATDAIIEGSGNGSDRILSYVSYVLGAGVAVELITTTNSAGTSALNLTGNEFAQTIAGNAGANILDGRGGADTLIGYGGNDLYYVDSTGDNVVELAGEGSDRVLASVSYILAATSHVEILSTTTTLGTAAINLTGNAFVQSILGNAGANIINGAGGADTMRGLEGNDIYYVDNAADVVIEVAGGGSDRVLASVNYTLGAGAAVELFTTTNTAGTGALNLTGNDFGQHMLGNAGTNTLEGRGGNDFLDGSAGTDTLYGGGGHDTLHGGTGNDGLDGGDGNDTLFGQAGNDGLIGGLGVDSLYGGDGNDALTGYGGDLLAGGAGDDTYYINNAGDTVVEYLGEGIDYLETTLEYYVLPANVENGAPISGLYPTMYGNEADNIISLRWSSGGYLYGQGGNDTLSADNFSVINYNYYLYGGSGNDVLRGDDVGDYLQGDSGADNLWGGGYADTFGFVSWDDSTIVAFDVIHDFSPTDNTGDIIDLSAIDAIYNPDIRANDAFTYIAFGTGAAGQIWWVQSAPNLFHVYADFDGGGADIRIDVVTSSLSTSDFIF